ncbi:MAG: nitrous oxide-stimulated promoter family protein [Nitrospirae bacterium]|nr:nitrous oxide-stimulated promoter family protein [Nitrospirota bacterium]
METTCKIKHPRMIREAKTIEAMINLYCRDLHCTNKSLCIDCRDLLEYALARLDKCPFQEKKSTCGKCLIHCYKPKLREKIQEVMRYSGPRMIRKHPIMALYHLFDGLKKPTDLGKKP